MKRLRLRLALLLCLMAAALFTAAEALRGLRRMPDGLPREIYESYTEKAEAARYVLRGRDGYVAIFEGRRARAPSEITAIELRNLRRADRAMIEAGLPVLDRQSLLLILEDLGS